MLGSDYECFLVSKGTIVPETMLGLPGKTEPPQELRDGDGVAGFIHRDNVMVELCSLPATSAAQMAHNVGRALAAGAAWVKDRDNALSISTAAAHQFLPEMLSQECAHELGCDVDFISCDYDSEPRMPLIADDIGLMRFSGGHVHISYTNDLLPAWLAACLCDLFIGIPIAARLEARRAVWYGDSTLHRPTFYPNGDKGVEYRPLDNFWVHSAQDRLLVAQAAQKVQDVIEAGEGDLVLQLYRLHEELPQGLLLTELGCLESARAAALAANGLWAEACGS